MTLLEQIRRADATVPPEVLAAAVRRIVAVADPERIILFGSAARGEPKPDSDLDILVVKDGDYDHYQLTSELYRALGTAQK